jgi:hypothetical protein
VATAPPPKRAVDSGRVKRGSGRDVALCLALDRGGQRGLPGAAQLGVELTGRHPAGEEGGERSLLSLAKPSR